MTPEIPRDHLDAPVIFDPNQPRLWLLGFGPFHQQQPPPEWLRQHELAEAGGYFRMGRAWTRLADEDRGAGLRLVGIPMQTLYAILLARVGSANAFLQGWCVDA